MKKEGKNIDDLFKEELGNYTETPPPAVWDALEKKLEGTPPPLRRLPHQWLGYFTVLILTLVLTFVINRNFPGNKYGSQGGIMANAAPVTQRQSAQQNNAISGENRTEQGGETTPVSNDAAEIDENTVDAENNTGNGNNKGGIMENKGNGNPAIQKSAYFHSTEINNEKNGNNDKTGARQNKPTPGNIPNNYGSNPVAGINSNTKNEKSGSRKAETSDDINFAPANDGNNKTSGANENTYNSAPENQTATNPGKLAETGNNATPVTTQVNKDAAAKIDKTKPVNKIADKMEAAQVKQVFPRFEAGVKAGYERGFNNEASTKFVGSPYVQYNISPKFSIMVQPSAKESNLDVLNLGSPQSYYQVSNGTIKRYGDSSLVVIVPEGGASLELWKRDYQYTQTHDSIVKSYSIGGNYMEYELPVLLKYKLNKHLSAYGGVNISYSKMISVKESSTDYAITISKSESTLGGILAPAPTPLPLSDYFSYSGNPYSNYKGPAFTTPSGSLIRYGYMLGFSYEYNKRWLIDGLIEQTPIAPTNQSGYDIKYALGAAYFRFTLGYKLTK